MKILLIGTNGQLGSDLVKALTDVDLIPLTHRDVDICEPVGLRETLGRHAPDVVINTAAYHKVDECETNVEKTFAVNTHGVRNLALACKEQDCALLHMSTDYVFGGDTARRTPYNETDPPSPINVYGIAKLAGEYFVRYILDRHWIVRSQWLYGVAGASGKGGNFVELMLRLAREGRDIKVVDDQVGSPTYTVDLARKIAQLVKTEHYGLYHITNAGECTWYQFAREIWELSGLHPNAEPTTTAAFGAVATRPAYSVLDNAALRAIGQNEVRTWREALAAYLREKGHIG
ncbi:MAG: dTDP-4-dehydrorhamnose reductase [Chloroflexota bacterium]|nr:dTDP-4-dehydrorhamnose reductase [Chloroflexota bacterium]